MGSVKASRLRSLLADGSDLDLALYDQRERTVKDFGAKGDGATDDTEAIQSAINAANGQTILVPAGIYRASGLVIPKGLSCRMVGAGSGTIFKATGSAGILTVSDDTAGSADAMISLKDLRLDGNGTATNGLKLLKAQNFLAESLYVSGCGNGILIDGTPDKRLLTLTFLNCLTTGNGYGVRFIPPPTPQTTSYTAFVLIGHSSEGDGEGISIDGNPGLGLIVTIQGGEIQNSSVTALRIATATVTMENVYVEAAAQGQHAILSDGAVLTLKNCICSNKFTVDATSVVRVEQSQVNSWGPKAQAYSMGGAISDFDGWGPPNWPSDVGKTGAVYLKGFRHVDKYGVPWTCTTAGTSGDAAFSTLDGKVIVPLTYADLTNGHLLWWPQEDFVLTDVSVVITTPFVANTATHASLGLPTGGEEYISIVQGSAANWAAASLLQSSQNVHASALLNGGKGYVMAGATPTVQPGSSNRVSLFTNGTWTSGVGKLIVRGYHVKFN